MDIVTTISKLKENDLRTKIVIPTLLALGIYKVEDWHGRNEEGKDIYFAYKDPFGDYKHCCCFIKSGNITKSGKTDIRKMDSQLKEALMTKFVNPIDNKTEAKTEEIYILCNGEIKKDAKNYICDMIIAHSMPNIRIIDRDKLVNIIMEKVINLYNKKHISDKQYIFNIYNYLEFCLLVRDEFLTI
jgi:hypothetical protein